MTTWETVAYNTYRIPVPGGWLYRYGTSSDARLYFVAER